MCTISLHGSPIVVIFIHTTPTDIYTTFITELYHSLFLKIPKAIQNEVANWLTNLLYNNTETIENFWENNTIMSKKDTNFSTISSQRFLKRSEHEG